MEKNMITHKTVSNLSPSSSENGFQQARPRSAGQKVKAHFRRFWWLHLIIFLAGTLAITLILVYVIFPHIAQSGIDDSSITIQSLMVTDPTPNSVRIVQNAVISSTNMYHPYLDAFNVSIALLGAAPYANMLLPGVQSGDSVPVTVDQVLDITDLDAFSQYNAALMKSDTIQQTISGSTGLHEMAFPVTTVNYDKTVTMNGFNSLKGFNVTEFSVLLKPLPDGTNSLGTVYIPNPTVLTIAMGNVTFNNYAPDGTYVGNSTINDLVLKPGNNTLQMSSIVDQTTVLSLISNQFKDGMLPLNIVGNSSIYNGQHLTYYEAALKSSNQSVTLNIKAALEAAASGAGSGGI